MPEHLRALVVLLVLAVGVFVVARQPAAEVIGPGSFARRRNLWFALTLTVFLAHSFWIYSAIASVILLATAQRDQSVLAVYFVALFAVPPVQAEIPGFGIINYLFALDHLRLLSLVVLLPAFLILRRREETVAFGRLGPDWLLLAYLLLTVLLQLRETTFTDTARQGLYVFLDVFLPYYVASRSLRYIADFYDALFSFLLAAMLLAAVGVFEAARHWLLYGALISALGLKWDLMSYLGRAGALRASGSTGHAIALGTVLTVAIGFFLFVKERVSSRVYQWLGALMLTAGLLASLSRGPWIGAVVLLVAFLATGPFAVRRLSMLVLAGLAALPLLAVAPGGEKLLDLLPIIGSEEQGNVEYRQRLIENAVVVIERNPWLGSVKFLEAPEMQEMRQGQGIIDLVNTYVAVALQYGVVGLALFGGFFLFVLVGITKALRSLPKGDDEAHRLGRALLAVLVAVMTVILTVSTITVIPVVLWSVAGMGVAYRIAIQRSLAGGVEEMDGVGAPTAVLEGRIDRVPAAARHAG